MGAYNLQVGDDLDARTLALSIPDETAFLENKIIAATHNGNYIVEGLVDGESVAGITDNANWSALADLDAIFYNTDDDTNETSVDLPVYFGTVIEIDESAVIYPYVKRTANEKVYGMTEDLGKEELKDFVIERGFIELPNDPTHNGWKYKKWNSGECEAWVRLPMIIQGDYSVADYVPDIFESVEIALSTVSAGSRVDWNMNNSSFPDGQYKSYRVDMFPQSSGMVSVEIYIYLKGSWK